MEFKTMLKGAMTIGIMSLPALPALAQETSTGGMPFTAKMSRTFGPTGLISEFSQAESYGSVQTRQAQSRANIGAANADSIYDGYEDSAQKFNLPVTLNFSTPSNDAGWRVKGTYTGSWADENQTYADSDGVSGLIQYLTMPTSDLMLGYGVIFNKTDVDIQHNGGGIDTSNWGLQFDLLKNLNPHWGLAGRVIYRQNETETTIPLGFADLVTDQGSETFYTEWTLVGNYEHDAVSWVPEGWLLRPRFRALYTRTDFETVTNSLGGTNEGTVGSSDEYASIQAKVRLLQPVFRPGQTGFYIEGGFEREVINDLNLYLDDPNILHAKVGMSKMFDNGVFMDAGIGIEHGTEGLRDLTVATLAFSKSF